MESRKSRRDAHNHHHSIFHTVTYWLIVGHWIRKLVVLESILAIILLDQIVGKPDLLEEPGGEFALKTNYFERSP